MSFTTKKNLNGIEHEFEVGKAKRGSDGILAFNVNYPAEKVEAWLRSKGWVASYRSNIQTRVMMERGPYTIELIGTGQTSRILLLERTDTPYEPDKE